jgi:hypothetical protein
MIEMEQDDVLGVRPPEVSLVNVADAFLDEREHLWADAVDNLTQLSLRHSLRAEALVDMEVEQAHLRLGQTPERLAHHPSTLERRVPGQARVGQALDPRERLEVALVEWDAGQVECRQQLAELLLAEADTLGDDVRGQRFAAAEDQIYEGIRCRVLAEPAQDVRRGNIAIVHSNEPGTRRS